MHAVTRTKIAIIAPFPILHLCKVPVVGQTLCNRVTDIFDTRSKRIFHRQTKLASRFSYYRGLEQRSTHVPLVKNVHVEGSAFDFNLSDVGVGQNLNLGPPSCELNGRCWLKAEVPKCADLRPERRGVPEPVPTSAATPAPAFGPRQSARGSYVWRDCRENCRQMYSSLRQQD